MPSERHRDYVAICGQLQWKRAGSERIRQFHEMVSVADPGMRAEVDSLLRTKVK